MDGKTLVIPLKKNRHHNSYPENTDRRIKHKAFPGSNSRKSKASRSSSSSRSSGDLQQKKKKKKSNTNTTNTLPSNKRKIRFETPKILRREHTIPKKRRLSTATHYRKRKIP
jgi:hypothetical protein